jgi:hypothetical protein
MVGARSNVPPNIVPCRNPLHGFFVGVLMGHISHHLGCSITTGAVMATIRILDGDTVVDGKQGNTNENPIPDDETTTLRQ